MPRLINSNEDIIPVVKDLYQYAVEQWPIPEVLSEVAFHPEVPSALFIIFATTGLKSPPNGKWPKDISELDFNFRKLFVGLAMLLESSDELYPSVFEECSRNEFMELCKGMDRLRSNVVSGPEQFKYSFSDRKMNSLDNVEWYYDDIFSTMRTIYKAGIRAMGGEVFGSELLILVQSFRIPELWHEVVISGRRPNGPFEIMSWIANQRDCDVGTALKIMHIIAIDAAADPTGQSREALLAKLILENIRKRYYKTSNFTAMFSDGAQLDRMTPDEMLNFFLSQRLERFHFNGRDIPLYNSGFGIILGVGENAYSESGKRQAVNAFKQAAPKTAFSRALQYLRGGRA